MDKKKKKSVKKTSDINVLAASIVEQATGQSIKNQPVDNPIDPEVVQKAIAEGKDPLAVLLGQRGGLKGGKARAEKLSPKKRKEIAKKAADARWGKKK